MEQTYSVTGKFSFANIAMEALATEALQMYIKTNLDDVERRYLDKGIYSNTMKGCLNILLSDQGYSFDHTIDGDRYSGTTVCTFSSGFDASYGWFQIMENAFRCVEKYIEDGSYMDIYPDHGFTRFVKKKGKIREYATDEETNKYFDSAEEMYDDISGNEYGFYNTKTGDYLFKNENGCICHTILGEREVKDLCWMCNGTELKWYDRLTEAQEKAVEYLGYEDTRKSRIEDLEEILDSAVERNAEEDWTTATSCVAVYLYGENV